MLREPAGFGSVWPDGFTLNPWICPFSCTSRFPFDSWWILEAHMGRPDHKRVLSLGVHFKFAIIPLAKASHGGTCPGPPVAGEESSSFIRRLSSYMMILL